MLAAESIVPVETIDDIVNNDIQVEPLDTLPTGKELSESLVVKGDVGVGEAGAAGAVDRLTLEIAASLEQRPTLVCWVFDQSVSLAGQRKEIAVPARAGVRRTRRHDGGPRATTSSTWSTGTASG